MPKMTHWNSLEPIDVSSEKAAVYAAQGWTTVDKGAAAPKVAMTRAAADEEAPAPVKKAVAKKATVKKTAAKKQ